MENLDCIVVIPVYNEEGCIEAVLDDWCRVLSSVPDFSSRIFVVNDGSQDGTANIVEQSVSKCSSIRVIHQDNGGHGTAVVKGYREALATGARYVFQVDSDNQIAASEFPLLWKIRAEGNLVLGWRQQRNDPRYRLELTRLMRLAIRLLFQVKLVDPNVPFRLIESSFLEEALRRMPSSHIVPNVCMSIIAALECRDVAMVPIAHVKRTTGKVSIVRLSLIRFCVRAAYELLRLKIGYLLDRGLCRSRK